ncbi:YHS domain protein [bacterium BMS3Abin04]|nr:YHS domain protein [bacterium BMS3Abin04]
MERDPVCGMELNNILDVPRSAYKGGMIYFCCQKCKEMFDNDPETYIPGMHYELNINKHKPYKCECDNIALIYSRSRR